MAKEKLTLKTKTADPQKERSGKSGKFKDLLKEENEAVEYFYSAYSATESSEAAEKTEASTAVKNSVTVRRVFVFVAAVMMFFAVIGAIVSAGFVWDRVVDIRNRQSLKDEFALFIYPVVINDPPAFESVDHLQPSTIITCAIWRIILKEDMSHYATDIGVIYIPAIDVEAAARSLFGTVRFEQTDHQSVSSRGIQFIFSEQYNHYEIPENTRQLSYSPLITSVTNVGETYTVTVDYMLPSPLQVAGIEHDNAPIKTMIYTISRTRDRMTVDSIQAADPYFF